MLQYCTVCEYLFNVTAKIVIQIKWQQKKAKKTLSQMDMKVKAENCFNYDKTSN